MKFLCDRCQTRYSIGDDRVRGKILKIRCKHCSNVITVREGMTAPSEGSVAQALPEPPGQLGPAGQLARPKKSTTMAPEALDERQASGLLRVGAPKTKEAPSTVPLRPPRPAGEPAVKPPGPGAARPTGFGGGLGPKTNAGVAGSSLAKGLPRGEPDNALGAAFASAMAKPPPALEEEWYVSIDGDQSGPYSLAEAQRWVAGKPFDADLHCWSEGFDDWLPVDKVSHFRNLRKRPLPPPTPAPPPRPAPGLPRATAASIPPVPAQPGPAQAGPSASQASEDTPVPLFAATMASLERGAPAAELPPSRASATPAFGTATPPRTNGAAKAPSTPVATRAVADDLFDALDDADGDGDGKTQLQATPMRIGDLASGPVLEGPPGLRGQGPGQRPGSSDAGLTRQHMPAATDSGPVDAAPPELAPMAAGLPAGADFRSPGDDEDLAIGEVSRVVNLADLARTPRPQPANRRATGANPALRATGAQVALRATGGMPIVSGPASGPVGGDAALAPMIVLPPAPATGLAGYPTPPEPVPPLATSHRRGLIALLGVAVVLVVSVIIAVVVFTRSSEETTSGTLGKVNDIDTSRPDDPTSHHPGPGPGSAGSNAGPGTVGANPNLPRPNPPIHRPNPPVGSNREPDPPAGDALRSDEIEDTARKHQDMTQRCYMRSQRGADAILVGDVKKIAVTLQIDKDGGVGDVQLSDHTADTLGKCLQTSIRTWKFRPSSGGRFRFSLNFVSG